MGFSPWHSKRMPVVLTKQWTAPLAHKAVGHALSAPLYVGTKRTDLCGRSSDGEHVGCIDPASIVHTQRCPSIALQHIDRPCTHLCSRGSEGVPRARVSTHRRWWEPLVCLSQPHQASTWLPFFHLFHLLAPVSSSFPHPSRHRHGLPPLRHARLDGLRRP